MIRGRVLIISDQQEEGDLLAHGIMKRGIHAISVGVDQHTLEKCTHQTYDVVIINRHGTLTESNDEIEELSALCRGVRATFVRPLLVFTYERDERYLMRLYHDGVDECVKKPIGIALFLAKVMTWIRFSDTGQSQAADLSAGNFQLNALRRELTTPDGTAAHLSELEYRLFQIMLSNRGHVLATDQLTNGVWHGCDQDDGRLLRNLVYRLRRKIEPIPHEPRYIQTIPGEGYRFQLYQE